MTKIKRPQQIQHWEWQCTNEGSEIEDKALLIQRRKKKPLYVKKRLHHDDRCLKSENFGLLVTRQSPSL